MKKIIITSAIIAAIATAGCVLTSAADSSASISAETSADGGISHPISREDFTRAAEQTVNGVVSVKSFATPSVASGRGADQYYSDPLLEFFFGTPQRRQQPQHREKPRQQQLGLGSGVIISDDGYIVTNNHVIADAERLEVTLNDNRNYSATVIGADPTTDLALIKIEAPDLSVIPMGDSEKLRLGEWVLAVGNPFGFTSTVTSGIVSAKARNISTSTGTPSAGGIESFIQTDAAVNRGNSGGALVNLNGELVGINTAIYSQTGTYAGCSFAIPTSIVQKVVADLKSYGTVQRAYLGIRFVELSPELVAEKNIKGATSGIYVAQVEDRSAALEAGIEEEDIIVAINGKPTRSTAELQEVITSFSPGDKVKIEYVRDGKKGSATATLRNNRGETGITRSASEAGKLGATFAAIDRDTMSRLNIRSGVAVADVEPDGLFAAAGVRQGFIIISVNSTRVTSPEEITKMAAAITKLGPDADKVLFISGIYPTGKAAYYAVPLND